MPHLPPALPPESTLGLVYPASSPRNWNDLEAGIAHLEQIGYHIERHPRPETGRGYLAAPDSFRIQELNMFLEREDIDGLICARGGYGTARLIDRINYDTLQDHPKLLIGSSDITTLQLAIYAKTGIPSLAGPMVASEWSQMDDETEQEFLRVARGDAPILITAPDKSHLSPVQPGKAEGPLIGGNFTCLLRIIGTPFCPSFDNALLFVEDVGEPPYRIDGMLAHLRHAGILDKLGGLIFGRFTEREPDQGPTLTLTEVIEDYASYVNGPVVSNLCYGHVMPRNSLPIGVRARMTCTTDNAAIEIIDPVAARK